MSVTRRQLVRGLGFLFAAAGLLVTLDVLGMAVPRMVNALRVLPAIAFLLVGIGEPFIAGMVEGNRAEVTLTFFGAVVVYWFPAALLLLLGYRRDGP